MASCYNFNWWFDGSKCIIPLSSSPPLAALARHEGPKLVVTVYGVGRGGERMSLKWSSTRWGSGDLAEFYKVAGADLILR